MLVITIRFRQAWVIRSALVRTLFYIFFQSATKLERNKQSFFIWQNASLMPAWYQPDTCIFTFPSGLWGSCRITHLDRLTLLCTKNRTKLRSNWAVRGHSKSSKTKVNTTKRSVLLLLNMNHKLAWDGTGLKEIMAFFLNPPRKDV